MEVRSRQDPPRLQCTSHRLYETAVINQHPQIELAINTYLTVSGTHNVVSNTQTMVSDIHRTIVHGQEGNDGKISVSGLRIPALTE